MPSSALGSDKQDKRCRMTGDRLHCHLLGGAMDLIIDLDSLMFKAGFTVESRIRHIFDDTGKEIANFKYMKDLKEFLKEEGLKREDVEIREDHIVGEERDAIKLLDILIADIKSHFEGADTTMYLGGEDNFRYEIKDDYKANRANMPRPVHLAALTEYAISRGANVPHGYEADDAVCIHAWDCIRNNRSFAIAGIDKDLRQIPGTHYDYGKAEIIEIDPYTADFNFYCQVLTGDTSDNIPGLKGIGIKKATKILEPCDTEIEMYDACAGMWPDEDEMNISASLLYLLRSEDDKWQRPE